MKRQIKQTLAKVLVVCMILSMLPVSAFAATETLSKQTNGINWLGENGEYYVKGDVTLNEPYYITGDANAEITYAINVDTQYKLTMDTIYVENVDTLTVGGTIMAAAGKNEVSFFLKGSAMVLTPSATASVKVNIAATQPMPKGISLMSVVANPKVTISGDYTKGLELTKVDATVEKATVSALTVNGGEAKLTEAKVTDSLTVDEGATVTVESGTLTNVKVTDGKLVLGNTKADIEGSDVIKVTGTVEVEKGNLVIGEDVDMSTVTEIKLGSDVTATIPETLKGTVQGGNVTYYHKTVEVTVGVEDVNGKPVEGAELTYKVGTDAETKFAPVEGDVVYATTEDALALTVKVPEGYKVKTWRVNGEDQKSTDTTYELTVDAKLQSIVVVLEETEYTVTFEAPVNGTYTYAYEQSPGHTMVVDVTAQTKETFNKVTKLTLTATPAEGYKFVGWDIDGETYTGNPYDYTVKSDATIKPVFKEIADYTVTFEIVGKGTVTYTVDEDTKAVEVKDGDEVTVVEDTVLTLTAEAAEGYEFVGWTIPGEAETVTTAEATYKVGADATIKAVFEKLPVAVEYTVTVDTKPATGGTVTYKVDKDTTAKAVTGPITFKEGETVTLTAKANDGYEFVGWQVDGKTVETKDTYKVTADATITAVFEKIPVVQYKLTVKADPTNGGTITGSGKYIAGATVTVTAKANTGYKFDGWFNAKNEKVSGDAEYSFAITADTELTAKFSAVEPEPEMVTVEVKATAGGTATVNGETKVEVEAGTTVTLVATAASGYEFVNWTDASGEEVTVGADGKYKAEKSVVLTANFKAKTPSGPVGPFIPSGPTGPSTPSHVCPAAAYTDVNQNMWYHEAVDYVVEHGYMQGISATEFAPNHNITRADVALVLYRMQNSPAVEVGATYSDVDAGAYYAAAVAWADANGIVNGYGDGTFKPSKNITREELVAVMSRYAAFLNANVTGSASLARFADAADVSAYAVAPMQWAVQTAIIQGTSVSTLVPKHTATRAQFAAMIMRLCENVLAK